MMEPKFTIHERERQTERNILTYTSSTGTSSPTIVYVYYSTNMKAHQIQSIINRVLRGLTRLAYDCDDGTLSMLHAKFTHGANKNPASQI